MESIYEQWKTEFKLRLYFRMVTMGQIWRFHQNHPKTFELIFC